MTAAAIAILFAQLVWFFLPAGLANMAPVFAAKLWPQWSAPVDGGRLWGGRPLFGSHKTWRGMVAATLTGGAVFGVQYWLAGVAPTTAGWAPFDITAGPWWFGVVFGAAAITGDLLKSFAKRRIGVADGKPWVPFDQIDFLLAASLVAMLWYPLTWWMAGMMLVLGAGLTYLASLTAYYLKLKDVPW